MSDVEPMLDALGRAARLLAAWSAPSAVVGGIGIVARVRPRLTTDIDVVIVVTPDRVTDLLALAEQHGWAHDPAETAELARGGLARLWSPPSREAGIGLDLLFVDSEFLESVVTRASAVEVAGVTLPVASVEDLLIMKLEADRPQDIDDILAIKDAFADVLDLAYVRAQTDRLGLTARLELYLGDAEV